MSYDTNQCLEKLEDYISELEEKNDNLEDENYVLKDKIENLEE